MSPLTTRRLSDSHPSEDVSHSHKYGQYNSHDLNFPSSDLQTNTQSLENVTRFQSSKYTVVVISCIFSLQCLFSMMQYVHDKDNFYALLCIVQNMVHLHYFLCQLGALKNIQIDSEDLLIVTTHLVNQNITAFKLNMLIFMLMFFYGIFMMFDSHENIWFLLDQLLLGFIFLFGLLTSLMIFCVKELAVALEKQYTNFEEPYEIHLPASTLADTVIDQSQLQACYICLEEYQPTDTIIVLSCSHIYHQNCLMLWIEEQPKCPVCRYDLQ